MLSDHVDDARDDEGDRNIHRNRHVDLRVLGQNRHPGKVRCANDAARGILFQMIESRVRQNSPNSVSTSCFRSTPRAIDSLRNSPFGQQNA
ncbi:hypothetical protein NN3_30690 [Nocardia neocaledoniensis NBRC 108232]|nr:hypothetical protein NN3_30690 [Nocardia neocaledoniensis NBRC 108232]